MKNILVIVFCLFVMTAWAKEEKNKRIQYCTTLEEAIQQATRENKPIFFNCYAKWAGGSVLMDSIVLNEPELVAFIRKHFVSLRVDMVKTPEGRKLAEQYKVRFYAHFLILDKNGELQHRIVGGAKAPEFREKLKQGLNPKTSLAGMNRRYEKGERSEKFLAAYARALDLADEKEKYQEITDYYLGHIDSTDLYSPRSWEILKKRGRHYGSEWFNFIARHKTELTQQNGKEVTEFIVGVAFGQIYPYIMLEKPYDSNEITVIEEQINTLDSTSATRNQLLAMCRIIHLRQQKKYAEMLELWERTVPGLPNELQARCDLTLGQLQDMEDKEKQQAVAYLSKQMERLTGTRLKRYSQAQKELSNYQGICFEIGSLREALAKAQKEQKPVFVDCYTSWCGPCKMMSSQVFPDKQAGDYFNPRFVSIKIDMEKNEGKELAQKWGVRAFPTYLILSPEGEIVYTSRGYMPAEKLIKQMKEGLEQWQK